MKSERNYKTVDACTAELKRVFKISDLRVEVISNGNSKEELARYMNAYELMQLAGQLGSDYPYRDRNRLVNFTSVVRGQNSEGKDFPSTVEFRQAIGSLDADDIMRWVELCIGLVIVADFYYWNPEKFPVKTWDDPLSVFVLMKDMGLSEEAHNYWDGKRIHYASRGSRDREFQTDNEDIPEDPPSSDCEDGENDDNGHGFGGGGLGKKKEYDPNNDDDEFGNNEGNGGIRHGEGGHTGLRGDGRGSAPTGNSGVCKVLR
jgi:hypothetical protein